jgi:hypothetical protein
MQVNITFNTVAQSCALLQEHRKDPFAVKLKKLVPWAMFTNLPEAFSGYDAAAATLTPRHVPLTSQKSTPHPQHRAGAFTQVIVHGNGGTLSAGNDSTNVSTTACGQCDAMYGCVYRVQC